jgi:DNA polymerase-4
MHNKVIMLVDMNCFYASVHQALDTTLRGKPVIVAGDSKERHGIVLAKSYECKKYAKITTGMSFYEAKALIPHAIFINPQHDLYLRYSVEINKILETFSPLVEPFSIDESFIDVSGCEKLFGLPLEIAQKIQDKIYDDLHIPCSIGIGVNKLCAKQAAEFKKPMGISTLWPPEVNEKLWPLPIDTLFGIGRRLKKRMNSLRIDTIGDLANYDVDILKRHFGVMGLYLWKHANGIDDGFVDPHSIDINKSIGNQITLATDYTRDTVKTIIMNLAEEVGSRVRVGEYVGRTIHLTIRDCDLAFYGWSYTLPEATELTEEIYQASVTLLEDKWPEHKKIRMIGVSLCNLSKKVQHQYSFFTAKDKLEVLNQTVDKIRESYGQKSIVRGRSLL